MGSVNLTALDNVTVFAIEANDVVNTLAMPANLSTIPFGRFGAWVFMANGTRYAVTGANLAAIQAAIAAAVTGGPSTAAPPDIAAASAIGAVSARYAREDHTHGHGNLSDPADHAVALEALLGVTGVAGFMSAQQCDALFARRQVAFGIIDEFVVAVDARWSTLASGAGAGQTSASPTADHPGIFTYSTGTTTTGQAGYATGFSTTLILGGGTTHITIIVKVDALSTAGEEFLIRMGALNAATAPGTGCWFEYDRLGVGANWLARTRDGSGALNTIDTGVAVDTGWHRFDIVVTQGGTPAATFYIDGVQVATTTTAIPTTNLMGRGHYIVKSAGTTARTMQIDYWADRKILTNAR